MVAVVNPIENRTLAANFDSKLLDAVRRILTHGPDAAALASLSEWERQIFDLVGQGWGAQDISVDLLLHRRTVAHHFRCIREKLGLKSQAELEGFAVRLHVLGFQGVAISAESLQLNPRGGRRTLALNEEKARD